MKTALDKAILKMEAGLEKELAREYAATLKEVRRQVGEVYAKHAVGGALEYSELAKYDRLRKLEKSLAAELTKLTGKTARITKTGLAEIFEDSYYRTAFEAEKTVQAKLAFRKLNPDVVKMALQNPISGLTLNDRLAKNRADIVINIKQTLTQGLIKGSSIDEMSRTLKGTLEGDLVKAKRVVQTEAHRVKEQAREEAIEHAEEQGVVFKKIWVATLDDVTRDTHAELDGQEADEEGYFHFNGMSAKYPGGWGDPAMDINCRCTVRVEVMGFEPKVRRVRGEGVVPYKDYKQWHSKRIANA